MSDPFDGRPFPRVVLIGAATLIGFSILAVAMVRLTGVGMTTLPLAPVIEARELVFLDQDDGITLAVIPGTEGADDDALVARLESGVDGFVLGVLRTTNRDRKLRGIPLDEPYLLAVREDGRLVFNDPATGGEIDVRAFGPTNFDSFLKLLRTEPRPLQAGDDTGNDTGAATPEPSTD